MGTVKAMDPPASPPRAQDKKKSEKKIEAGLRGTVSGGGDARLGAKPHVVVVCSGMLCVWGNSIADGLHPKNFLKS
jgi:hypothetical protein